ncbi:MAG: hypothetical protein ACP5XB_05370 [Isosphaeraceae bacterium]
MMFDRQILSAFALAALLCWPVVGAAQEPGKSIDEALDSLLEKLEKPGQESKPDNGPKPAKDAKSDAQPAQSSDKPKPNAQPAQSSDKPKPNAGATKEPAKPSKDAQPAKQAGGDVSGKDKEIDELLEKLGETKDEPTAEEKRPGLPLGGQPGEPPRPGSGGEQQPKDRNKTPELQGKDKDLDERLEELTGRKKKKKNQRERQQGSGPLGQIIKEMRDVEQRLGKPETGEDTQSKQKKIVKDLETLIERMRQSGGSGSMALRMVRQAGQKQGNQPGQTPGSTAGGAPAQKPAKPSDHHAMPGGKDIWGHLPPELRQEMENVFKEEPLSAKIDLIRRYYLSVAKQKTNRGS